MNLQRSVGLVAAIAVAVAVMLVLQREREDPGRRRVAGSSSVSESPAEFAAFIKAERVRIARVGKEAGIVINP